MGAGKGGQTIGYKYFMSLHMGLGRGPANELKEIRVGDLTAWDTGVCTYDGGSLILIDKPDLFGGDEKEGGIRGPAYILFGGRNQNLPPAMSTGLGTLPSIAASLGGDVPNFRNVITVWFDGEVCALNPYPKEWAFRVRRTTAGWADDEVWYPNKATIWMDSVEKPGSIMAMNGAHILYETATNPDWGRGLPTELVDENSYIYAANQLCTERFGLCIPWFRQETIKDFSQMVIDHIGGAQYVDRATGKLTLRLIRGDYDPEDLPLFTPDSGLLSIEEDDQSAQEQAFNEIIVTGFDPTTKQEFSVRAQNLASIQSLGVTISNTIQYKGIPTRDLAARVAVRELKAQTGLRRFNVRLDRRAWRLAPAGLFRVAHPGRGIGNIILRIGDITELDAVSGEIQIKAVQDVFGLPETTYLVPQEPGWTPPDFTAVPPTAHRLIEMPYRDVYRRLDPANREAFSVDSTLLGELAQRPTSSSLNYLLRTTDGVTTVDANYQDFTATAVLAADVAPLDTEWTLGDAGLLEFGTEFVDGMAAMIGDEIVQITDFDPVYQTLTVVRGCADTIPAAHVAGDIVWLTDDDIGADGKEYVEGEEITAKALTRTSTDLLTEAEAEADEITTIGRFGRPYPPGNVQVDGSSIYDAPGEHPEPEITWTHRDRVSQADSLVGHLAADIGPEPGTTYTIRVYDPDDDVTPLREDTLIAGTDWTYDSAKQAVDSPPNIVRIELESVRDDLTSMFHYSFLVTLEGGYGYGYGLNYGGAGPES
jgi:hypothetical protein